MQDQPVDTHQIVSQSTAPTTWISQPTATLLASIVVLCGVIWTIKTNWNRFFKERVIEEAKDRRQCLRTEYGNFFAAAFDCVAICRHVGSIQAGLVNLPAVRGIPGIDEERVAKKSREAALKALYVERRSAMLSAFARLHLMRIAEDMLVDLDVLIELAYFLTGAPSTDIDQFEQHVRWVVGEVAKRIDLEYLDNRTQKWNISPPPIVLKNRFGVPLEDAVKTSQELQAKS